MSAKQVCVFVCHYVYGKYPIMYKNNVCVYVCVNLGRVVMGVFNFFLTSPRGMFTLAEELR